MAAPIPGWSGIHFDEKGREDLTHAGSPPSWNKLKINGVKLPGTVVVDVKHGLFKFSGRAAGKSPGSSEVSGREPGTASIVLTLADNAEWDEFVSLLPKVLPWVKEGENVLAGAVRVEHPFLAAHFIKWGIIDQYQAKGPRGGGPATISFTIEECQPKQGNFKVQQATPKPKTLEYAPTIDIAGQAPKVPTLRDYAKNPAQAAR